MNKGAGSSRAYIPDSVNIAKAKVKKKKNNDWSWEDEMDMYDTSHRDQAKKKRIDRKEEHKELVQEGIIDPEMEAELRRLRKEKDDLSLDQREERKIFLGGLSADTVEKDLRKHFEQFGQLADVKVMRDADNGVSRGFGFVTFACSFMAEAAFEHDEHLINDKKIALRLAKPDKKKNKKSLPELERESRDLKDLCKNKRSIYVGSLKPEITEQDLVGYFSVFGKVLRAHKIADKDTGAVKTYGFVDFAEFGVVQKIMNVPRHFIQGKRIRVDLSRPRIEFSHQTKTVFVGGLEDGIDDPELMKYFSEFGFVTRALRIPNGDEPKRKYGFIDFDDYDAVDIVVSQRDHYIQGHRVNVELALPMCNDSLYETDIVVPNETWLEKVQRKLSYAVPDQGTWGETMNTYEVFVQGGPGVKTSKFKIPRGMLEYTVGMGGKVVDEIANDTNTRIILDKPPIGAKNIVFTVTGKVEDVNAAIYIFKQIMKSNMAKLNTARPFTNS